MNYLNQQLLQNKHNFYVHNFVLFYAFFDYFYENSTELKLFKGKGQNYENHNVKNQKELQKLRRRSERWNGLFSWSERRKANYHNIEKQIITTSKRVDHYYNKNCLGSFQVLWNKNCTTENEDIMKFFFYLNKVKI